MNQPALPIRPLPCIPKKTTFALNWLEMNIETFIKQIEDEFDDLKPGVLKPGSNFREVFEWNSINALILIAMVKTEYDVTLTADDLIKARTVQDIYSVVESRVAK